MAFRRRKNPEWDGAERRAPAKVLVISDRAGGARLLVRYLRANGYRAAGTVEHASALPTAATELPRCVVIDISEGGAGTALRTLDEIRSHPDRRVSSTRAVLCSPDAKTRTYSFESGADAYLVRPYRAEDLVAALDSVLGLTDTNRPRHRREQLSAASVGDEVAARRQR